MAVRRSRSAGPGDFAHADLIATGPERVGWRVNVETPHGTQAYGVLVAPSHDVWRSRILTFPNILWIGPDARSTLKFEGRTPQEAERKAILFIREHCRKRSFLMRDEICLATPGRYEGANDVSEPAVAAPAAPAKDSKDRKPAQRKIRFLPVRFGTQHPAENAGTGNLSETGLFVITDTPAKQGDLLNLQLRLENKEITMRGTVRWHRKAHDIGRSPGMGVELTDPPVDYVNYVRALF